MSIAARAAAAVQSTNLVEEKVCGTVTAKVISVKEVGAGGTNFGECGGPGTSGKIGSMDGMEPGSESKSHSKPRLTESEGEIDNSGTLATDDISTLQSLGAKPANVLVASMLADEPPVECDVLLDELSTRLHGILPIQPSPLLLAPDHTPCTLKSTLLNGHLIYCFVIGGECRLCFPQIISVVLQGIKMSEVNELFVDLNIHISVASPQQLDALKIAGVMPMTADSCGLVTKSDAERLVAKLLPQCSGKRLAEQIPESGELPVMHDCFGGCTGTLHSSLQLDEQIECTHCKLLFTGEKFVSHSHSTNQIHRICHWGFDSSNWRHYLHLPEACEDDIEARARLQNYKYPNSRLGKRPASNANKIPENGTCAKLAKISTAALGVETETEATVPSSLVAAIGDESLNEIKLTNGINNETNGINFLKLCTIAQATVAALGATTSVNSGDQQGQSTLSQLPLPAFVATDYTDHTSGAMVNSQLQSLVSLQIAASQLPPLAEQLRLSLLTNPFLLASATRWKPSDSELPHQSVLPSALLPLSIPDPSVPSTLPAAVDNGKSADGRFNEGFTRYGTTNNMGTATYVPSKAGLALEKLLDVILNGHVRVFAQSMLKEFRRENELLFSQNEQLRNEIAVLRSALATATTTTADRLKEVSVTEIGIS